MSQEVLFQETPEAGSIVGGKYRLIRKLSEGGGGIVWEAADPKEQRIALKFLKWSPTKSRAALAERFKNEFAILKSLSHPNIAQIYDFGIDPGSGYYFFTSELLTGDDLRSMIGAPVPVLEDLLLQALRALEYLRNHRLLHLDIKPPNLLLRERGEKNVLAMIDFGLATFNPPDRPGGTPNYMAPELISMRINEGIDQQFPPPDHRTDLYSLGVTFYHCFTGVQPFCVQGPGGQADPMATLKRHLGYTPPPPSTHRPEIPSYIDRIIMKLMALHPDDRYPSAIVAAQALQYSSPRKHAPECIQTLLSYLPRQGRIIGRYQERATIETAIKSVIEGKQNAHPAICIAGSRGTGRSRLLMAAKPLAQQLEMEVTKFGEGNPITYAAIDEILQGSWAVSAGNHAIFVDDLDLQISGESAGTAVAALRSLIRRLRVQSRLPRSLGSGLFLLFTVSTDRANLSKLLTELDLDETICDRVVIKNFTSAEISEYLTTVLGETPDASVIDQLMRCTGGNPLYITEHLEQMISQGRIFSLAGRPDADTLGAIGVDFSKIEPPKSLSQTIQERLNSLPSETRKLAMLLACWHRPVSVEELKASSDSANVNEELLELIGARLVRRSRRDGRISFSNALSAHIIRDAAPPKALGAFHDRIAHVLRQNHIKNKAELDLHLAYGTRLPQRIPALSRLADKAVAQNEPLEAAAHIETMIGLIGEFDWKDKAAALARLGSAYEKARLYKEAKAAYMRIGRITAPKLLKDELKVISLERLGKLAMRRRSLKDARRLFSEAIDVVGHGKQSLAAKLRMENYLASVDLREGKIEEALSRFERTASVAENALTEPERNEITNNEMGDALLRSGNVGKAIEIFSKDIARAIKSGDSERLANRHYLMGNALRHDEVRRFKEAEEHYMAGLALAREHRLTELQVRLQNGLGNLCLKTNDPKAAMVHYQEGLKLAQQLESETTSVEIMIGMGLASQLLTQPESTIEYFEAALDFAKAPKGASAGLIRRFRPSMYVSLGDAYFQKHDLKHAEIFLKKALSLDKKHHLTPDIRYSLYGTYIEIFMEQGDWAAAKKFMPTVEAIARAFPPAQAHFTKLAKRLNS